MHSAGEPTAAMHYCEKMDFECEIHFKLVHFKLVLL
jgi:hypothetical protein